MKSWEYPPWAEFEDNIIRGNIERPEVPWHEIARRIGRTHGAVRTRAVMLRDRLNAEKRAAEKRGVVGVEGE